MLDRRSLLVTSVFLPIFLACDIATGTVLGSRSRPTSHYGCVIAKSEPRGANVGPQIDIWTSRISEFDMSVLPSQIGRVVIWDDLFSEDEIAETFWTIIQKYFPEWHGFDLRDSSNRIAMHLQPHTTIDDAFVDLLPLRSSANCERIALIDLTSCGVGPLDWSTVIPLIRNHYGAIVGIDFAVGDDCDFGPDTRSHAALCDLAFLCTDQILGFAYPSGCDERQPQMNGLLRRLIATLEQSAIETTLTRFSAFADQEHWIMSSYLPKI